MSLELRNGANVVDFGHFIGFGDIEQKKNRMLPASLTDLHFISTSSFPI